MTQEERDAAWNLIQRNLRATLDGQKIDCTFEELYRNVYKMCLNFEQGRIVYDKVRELLKQHIKKMATELENMANSQERNNQVLLQVDQHWFNFVDRMKLIYQALYYLVKVTIPKLVDGEELLIYGWRIFRTEILENQLIKSALANRLVLITENGMEVADAEEIADHMESPFFNVDTIIEIMTFLTTFKLGLQVSTAARQMAKLSDYVLNKRKRILRPIAIWNSDDNTTESFATQLNKEPPPNLLGDLSYVGNCYTSKAPEFRICLPETEPPEWLAGVELIHIMGASNGVDGPANGGTLPPPAVGEEVLLCKVCSDRASGFHCGIFSCEGCKGFFRRSLKNKIYYRPCMQSQKCQIVPANRTRCQECRWRKCIEAGMSKDDVDGLNDKIFAFLNALQGKLQNCQINFNIRSFLVKLQKTGHYAQFFALFNERCFSLVQDNLPWVADICVNFNAQWPCWAIFNGIFFPNLRELHFPLDKLDVGKMDVLKWLVHPSTEHQPRLLKLPNATVSENWLERGFVGMLRKIKDDFFNPTGRRMFFVELPSGTALSVSQQGEWQNRIGEQLRIHPNGITRLPVDQWDKKFEDFYELPAVQPKVVFK